MNTLLHHHPCVLIVDDEADYLQLMKFKLTAEGFKVEISRNGENVLDMLHNTPPDIILLDIKMNDVDGGTICHLLKTNETTLNIPIFLLSANDNIQTIAEQCGADGFIRKPFDIKNLKEILLNASTHN